MGRVLTTGLEAQAHSTEGEGATTSVAATPPTYDTSFARSGTTSIKCTTAAAGAAVCVWELGPVNTSTAIGNTDTLYDRVYFHFTDLPASTVPIMRLSDAAPVTARISARLTSAGKLQLWNDTAATQIGSDSVATIVTGQWYRIELKAFGFTLGSQIAELKLDGVTVASQTNLNYGTSFVPSNLRCGWLLTPGVSKTLHIDDVAINTGNGPTQNSYPGDCGGIVLSLPTGDSAVTGWTGGAGGTTNLFEAVNNVPPAGQTAAAMTDLTQIKDTAASATDNYDAVMQSYTVAGVPANKVVTLVQALIVKSANGTTGLATNGAIQVVSNPAQASEDSFGFSASTNSDDYSASFTLGAWRHAWGVAQAGDITARSTAPVLRVGRRTANARETDICFMGLMVEYGTTAPLGSTPRQALTGVGH